MKQSTSCTLPSPSILATLTKPELRQYDYLCPEKKEKRRLALIKSAGRVFRGVSSERRVDEDVKKRTERLLSVPETQGAACLGSFCLIWHVRAHRFKVFLEEVVLSLRVSVFSEP